jgi:GntR family transcriptional regulator
VLFRVSPSSGIPIYLQLVEQVKHGVEIGSLRAGDQLPAIRKLAEDLIINPNTVARAYRELEYAGIIELRHGSGAYVSEGVAGPSKVSRKAQNLVGAFVERLAALGLGEEEIRRLVESELALLEDARGIGEKSGVKS